MRGAWTPSRSPCNKLSKAIIPYYQAHLREREKKPMSTELRMLLAIVLSFAVFFVYQFLFHKEPPVQEQERTSTDMAVEQETPTVEEGVTVLGEEPPGEEAPEVPEAHPGRTIAVSTPLFLAELAERGGAFKTFRLKHYNESAQPNAPMQELIHAEDTEICTPVASFSGGPLAEVRGAVFRATTNADLIEVTEARKEVAFTWTSPEGIGISKIYSFFPDTYEIGLEIRVRNLSSSEIADRLTLSLRDSPKKTNRGRYVFSGPAAFINGELKEIDTKKIANEGSYTGRITWAANEDQYFISAIIPEKVQEGELRLTLGPSAVIENTYIDHSGPVAPKTERAYRYKLYFGPKSLEALGRVGPQLRRIVDFGFFDIIAKPLLHAMNFIHRYIPNYGIAIIFITVIVKLLFWPLSNKSYQSMSQMKRLQPKMAEIRAKFKNDKKMMNQELMNLYRVYKVNPLGGCLPMVLQIPVFFAFYKMLYQAIELRHAPFCLWINDLSAPDRLFSFNFKIPLMEPPYGIPVLTLVMGASMFFQQKMSPPPGDPTQAKMMMLMPIFFTFIFINFPSGLVLYWLVNNILSMAQQSYITKKTG